MRVVQDQKTKDYHTVHCALWAAGSRQQQVMAPEGWIVESGKPPSTATDCHPAPPSTATQHHPARVGGPAKSHKPRTGYRFLRFLRRHPAPWGLLIFSLEAVLERQLSRVTTIRVQILTPDFQEVVEDMVLIPWHI